MSESTITVPEVKRLAERALGGEQFRQSVGRFTVTAESGSLAVSTDSVLAMRSLVMLLDTLQGCFPADELKNIYLEAAADIGFGRTRNRRFASSIEYSLWLRQNDSVRVNSLTVWVKPA